MTPLEYLLVWFGMLTTGFMMGVGNQFAQYTFNKHIKHRLKVHLIGKTMKQKVYNENKIN